jgi:hypothetical protein
MVKDYMKPSPGKFKFVHADNSQSPYRLFKFVCPYYVYAPAGKGF